MADVRKNMEDHDKALLFDLCMDLWNYQFDDDAQKFIRLVAKFGYRRFKKN